LPAFFSQENRRGPSAEFEPAKKAVYCILLDFFDLRGLELGRKSELRAFLEYFAAYRRIAVRAISPGTDA